MFRYSRDHYFISSDPELRPDIGMSFLGAQAGMVFTKSELFLDKPLMLISTWDGDEFSFANYVTAAKSILNHKDEYFSLIDRFQAKLIASLQTFSNIEVHFNNGVGWIKGNLPFKLKKKVHAAKGRYIICPNWEEMERYLES